MTPIGWLALAAAFVIAALPSAAVARADGLVGGGRLVAAHRDPAAGRVAANVVRAAVAGAVTALLGVVAWQGGPALTVAAAVVLAVGSVLAHDTVRARRDTRRHRDLVTAVRVLAGELTAGARPADALTAAAATGEYAHELLGPAAVAQRAGEDAVAVLASSGEAGVRALGVAWRLGEVTGAALADVVERVAADLGAHDVRRRGVAVAVAGPRSSAALLAGLPVIGVALGVSMGAGPVGFLLSDPVGRLLCCVGVVLDAAGLMWMRRIVNRVQR